MRINALLKCILWCLLGIIPVNIIPSFNFIAEFDGTSNPANIDDLILLGFPCLAFEDKRGNVYPISADENFDNFTFI